MSFLKLIGVSKRGEGNFSLSDINLSQHRFQKIAVVGETGSGKSTLLKMIAGLELPDEGDILFENKKVNGVIEKLVRGHPAISYLSQQFELPKFLRVEQVLTYANILSEHEAQKVYQICQIDHLLNRSTAQLSGGEKQRIALAKLLIASPTLLLLDEPFSHLDLLHKNTLKAVIKDLGEKLKITIILVSHDPADTLSWADKIIVLKDGKIIQQGTPQKVYRQPASEYIAGLFGKYTFIDAAHSQEFLSVLGIKNRKKSLIIRPEHFIIVRKKRNSISGEVTAINFFGSYYEVELKSLHGTIIIKTQLPTITKGSCLSVSLDTRYLQSIVKKK